LLLDKGFVVEEKTNANYGEDDVDLSAENAGFFKDCFVGGQGFLLVTNE